jgi:hypothetical protein
LGVAFGLRECSLRFLVENTAKTLENRSGKMNCAAEVRFELLLGDACVQEGSPSC